jgi:hypothetical protein
VVPAIESCDGLYRFRKHFFTHVYKFTFHSQLQNHLTIGLLGAASVYRPLSVSNKFCFHPDFSSRNYDFVIHKDCDFLIYFSTRIRNLIKHLTNQ